MKVCEACTLVRFSTQCKLQKQSFFFTLPYYSLQQSNNNFLLFPFGNLHNFIASFCHRYSECILLLSFRLLYIEKFFPTGS